MKRRKERKDKKERGKERESKEKTIRGKEKRRENN